MSEEGMFGSDVVVARCPICDAGLEALRTTRYVPVAGRWREQGRESWNLRCVNGHDGEGESLEAAVRGLRRRYAY